MVFADSQSSRKGWSSKLKAYVDLTKPKLVVAALVAALFGYFLARRSLEMNLELFFTLFGLVMAFAGAASFNHLIEIERDRLMVRTQNRPLPQGVIPPRDAFILGFVGVFGGVAVTFFLSGALVGGLLLATAVLYFAVYTPMKTRTPLNTLVGSIPGALPPVIGWAAAEGSLSWHALIPFGILFVWQQPHFYAIAWLYRDDYKRGGFKMLPVVEPSGKWTFGQILVFTLVLVQLSLAPGLWGDQGFVYIAGVMVLSVVLMGYCFDLVMQKTPESARRFVRMTVLYLPILFGLTVIDAGLNS